VNVQHANGHHASYAHHVVFFKEGPDKRNSFGCFLVPAVRLLHRQACLRLNLPSAKYHSTDSGVYRGRQAAQTGTAIESTECTTSNCDGLLSINATKSAAAREVGKLVRALKPTFASAIGASKIPPHWFREHHNPERTEETFWDATRLVRHFESKLPTTILSFKTLPHRRNRAI